MAYFGVRLLGICGRGVSVCDLRVWVVRVESYLSDWVGWAGLGWQVRVFVEDRGLKITRRGVANITNTRIC